MAQQGILTVGTMLRAAAAWLTGHGFDEPRITVELLLARALGTDRAGLYARLGEPLDPERRRAFEELLTRRVNGEPVAYILGEREFYGLSFVVRPGVLVPRPETELLVEKVLEFAHDSGGPVRRIVDVGAGSGAVAVALATRLPGAWIVGVDVVEEAIAVARENAERHRVSDRVTFVLGDLLEPVAGVQDVVVGNLPYIPSAVVETLDRSVRDWEPRVALDGGHDGLVLHRRLLGQLRGRLRPGGLVLLEVADDRGEAAVAVFRAALPGAEVELLRDMFGRDRAVRAIMPAPG